MRLCVDLQIVNGRLFLQTTEKQLRPVRVVYKVEPPPREAAPPESPPELPDAAAEAEMEDEVRAESRGRETQCARP